MHGESEGNGGKSSMASLLFTLFTFFSIFVFFPSIRLSPKTLIYPRAMSILMMSFMKFFDALKLENIYARRMLILHDALNDDFNLINNETFTVLEAGAVENTF